MATDNIPTPRTDHAVDVYFDVPDGYFKLANHARTLERELVTWRQLPPREHYNVDDCHKALAYQVSQIKVALNAIEQIDARLVQLQLLDS